METILIVVIVAAMVIYVIGWIDAYNRGVSDTEVRWHDAVVRSTTYSPDDKITVVAGGTGSDASASATCGWRSYFG